MVLVVNDALLEDLRAGRPVEIDIGAGTDRRPGHYSLDRRELPGVDVVADLEEPLDAFPDASVARVHAHHVLEHVVALDALLDELHRILRPDGRLVTTVPHWANPLGFSDPTHVRFFGLWSWCYLAPPEEQPLPRKVPTYRPDRRFRIEHLELGFRPATGLGRRVERWVNASPRRMEFYERNLARHYWPYEIRCTLSPVRPGPGAPPGAG